MDDNRLGPLPGAHKAVQILVMMERVASTPVDKAGIGIGALLAHVVVAPTRMKKHVGDSRHRDEAAGFILARGYRRGPRHARARVADAAHAAVGKTESPARKTDLAEHGGEGDGHPDGLLAVIPPLKRPCGHDHRAFFGHAPGEMADGVGRNFRDRRRPLGVLGRAVRASEQIGLEFLVARAIAGEEFLVVKPFRGEGVGDAQHERRIGIGPRCDPFGPEKIGNVITKRRDVHELDPRFAGLPQKALHQMLAGAPVRHLKILEADSAKRDNHLRVAHQPVPGGGLPNISFAAKDIGHDDRTCSVAVGVHLIGEAAHKVHEALELGFGVVKAPGAGPAVGAGENRLVAVRLFYTAKLGGNQAEGLIPRNRHKGLPASLP